ncbi:hypothetical protein [Bacillus methanolicus]|uniref:Putative membrane protein n=1 Tax=Bacillus methanolicus (strain MGA3 / ATCC 53907) TaxID=796606 RepID=I3E2T9_BACMM|nr:hypothetical protein [Bacillus methanolicus]AIE59093.1 putative membrane protein [Bacillus methanolicus MGA3]EIJ80810.1 hypothetical protein MGA3_10925 [Bacillus methanolicus MGA3]
MTTIEFSGWTLSTILGISFFISLVALSRKPRNIPKKERKMTQSFD